MPINADLFWSNPFATWGTSAYAVNNSWIGSTKQSRGEYSSFHFYFTPAFSIALRTHEHAFRLLNQGQKIVTCLPFVCCLLCSYIVYYREPIIISLVHFDLRRIFTKDEHYVNQSYGYGYSLGLVLCPGERKIMRHGDLVGDSNSRRKKDITHGEVLCGYLISFPHLPE